MSDANPPPRPQRARHFVTGLLTLIPLGVTVAILYYLVRFLSALGEVPATHVRRFLADRTDINLEWLAQHEWLSARLGELFAVLIVLSLIYFLGMMTSNFVGRSLLRLFEAILARIPFVKTIYGAVKKLVDLMRQEKDSDADVQRVVLIDFPSPEMKAVGLVTRTFQDPHSGRRFAAVFVPTTPNPTNGYLEIVPVEKITATDWNFDEAMTFVVSGGALAPKTMIYDTPAGTEPTLPKEESDPGISQPLPPVIGSPPPPPPSAPAAS
ncbi:MAG: DUF502 domain-containing protein [Verrucomicrobiota bacterium]